MNSNWLAWTAAASLFLGAPDEAAAQMYRWVDKDGKTHYSDKPPPSDAKQGRTLSNAPSSAPTGSTAAKPDKPVPTQYHGRTLPPGQQGSSNALAIAMTQAGCKSAIGRYATLDEMLAGCKGSSATFSLDPQNDPRKDPNYDHRLTVAKDSFELHLVPRFASLPGYFTDGVTLHASKSGPASRKDPGFPLSK